MSPKSPKRTKAKRSANVPGQFYGYSVQITRVVAHFLRAQQGQSVSVEHLDDVATHAADGDVVEQDKSGLAHNPVSDRSPELWKTMANWVRAIRAGALKANTRFLVYVAQGHRGGLIDSIHAATSKVAADALVMSVRAKWGDVAKLPDGLSEHVKEVLATSDEVLARLFLNLTLENGSGAPNDDLAAMPGMSAISQAKKDDVLKFLLGWAKKTIDKRIEQGHAAIITWDEFQKQFVTAAKKLDRADTVLAATPVDVPEAELQSELRDRTYVRQLEIVKCADDALVQAVNDYLRSVAHRTNWSEAGDVTEGSFNEFEEGLDRAWKNQRSVIDIEQKMIAEEERGRLLYVKCQQLNVPLEGKEVPHFFVPGSFHALAESLRVGWHPRYRDVVSSDVTRSAERPMPEVASERPVSTPPATTGAAKPVPAGDGGGK